MLDKTVPFSKIKMVRRAGTPIPEFPLPDGYKYTFFKDGDEEAWARIETSVDEFDSEFAALLFFKEEFMPHKEDLYKRCLFVETGDGKKVATSTAWWSFVEDERRAWLHWVSVDPNYQGLGLGKAIVSKVTKLLEEIEGDTDFYLSTQTWSYKAINIYKTCGYIPTDEKALYTKKTKNDCKKSLKILKKLGITFP